MKLVLKIAIVALACYSAVCIVALACYATLWFALWLFGKMAGI